MLPVWKKEVKKAGLIPGIDPEQETDAPGFESFGGLSVDEVEQLARSEFKGDTSAPNGTSIAVVCEFDGKRVLFLGDAHMDVIERALNRFGSGSPVRFDAIKISHHGSKGTVSKVMLDRVECGHYFISTNGTRHGHPNAEAIASILKFGGDNFN